MSPRRHRRSILHKQNTPTRWLVIITLVAAFMAFILGWGGGAVQFIESYFAHRDDSYRPMDLERAVIDQLLHQNKR